jgi:hypothetical protein
MKKGLNLEQILDYIAVEEAPRRLIYKWKEEVQLQKEKKRFYSVFLKPSFVFTFILSGFWSYLGVFKRELFVYFILNKFTPFLQEIGSSVVSFIYSFASSNYYIIGVGIFCIFIAAISLFWFYTGKKWRYSNIGA